MRAGSSLLQFVWRVIHASKISMTSIDIRLEFTPNPNALKYVVDGQVLLERGSASFSDLAKAEANSPLAGKVLRVSGLESCMVGRDYITVTKAEDGDWEEVDAKVRAAIQSHIESGEKAVSDLSLTEVPKATGSEAEQKIIEFIDKDIRPAVAMDGGDIVFERYEDGIVYLYMKGACAGCPSSTATLKMGIEQRLQQILPEVKEVVAL